MDNNITQTVYDSLAKATKEIIPLVTELDDLSAEINSNRYTSQVLKDEMYPKRDALKQKVNGKINAAIDGAKALVAQYRKEAEEQIKLDPNEITDDIKLLQSGIPLLPRDIKAILERNKDNGTMVQLTLRYAKANNIDTDGTYYVGGQKEKAIADNLDGAIYYYSKWIGKNNALTMLDKFFGIA